MNKRNCDRDIENNLSFSSLQNFCELNLQQFSFRSTQDSGLASRKTSSVTELEGVPQEPVVWSVIYNSKQVILLMQTFHLSWIQGPLYKGGKLSGMSALWFPLEEDFLPYPGTNNSIFITSASVLHLIFLIHLHCRQGLAVLVIQKLLRERISQLPSLKLALWPEKPAVDPALVSYVKEDLLSAKLLASLTRLTPLSHWVHVAIRQSCAESSSCSCRSPTPWHSIKVWRTQRQLNPCFQPKA